MTNRWNITTGIQEDNLIFCLNDAHQQYSTIKAESRRMERFFFTCEKKREIVLWALECCCWFCCCCCHYYMLWVMDDPFYRFSQKNGDIFSAFRASGKTKKMLIYMHMVVVIFKVQLGQVKGKSLRMIHILA